MGKSRTDRHGNSREQKLLHENNKLKKLVSSLRKQLARVDIDRSSNLREIISNYYAQEDAEAHAEKEANALEELKREWKCNTCETGWLEILLLNKMDKLHYYRKCCQCQNRTQLQPYSKNVRGIIKKT